ncbi:MAG: C40 family peptidase [Lautropia sp.]|nr:C40 family peptidase [Lautropia sp.]
MSALPTIAAPERATAPITDRDAVAARRRLLLSAAALLLAGCASRQAALPRKAADKVTMQAMAQVGRPYRWGGSAPGEGFDCSGLVQYVYREALGIELPRTSREMSTHGTSVKRDALAPGDLVFFQTSRRPNSHVGIYIGDGRFVHAPSSGSLVRVESMDKRYWTRRFNGGRRPVL